MGEFCRSRSMVISQQGIAATSQPLAPQAAAQILARGGSAADTDIAANAVLVVVEPMMNGMGGDLFVVYRDRKAIVHNSRTATNYAASDPRSDGAAVPEPIRASHRPA
jgi:gamma-glutamyltranspeptidase